MKLNAHSSASEFGVLGSRLNVAAMLCEAVSRHDNTFTLAPAHQPFAIQQTKIPLCVAVCQDKAVNNRKDICVKSKHIP